jgi:hypothetical protein
VLFLYLNFPFLFFLLCCAYLTYPPSLPPSIQIHQDNNGLLI